MANNREDNVKALKENFQWENKDPFYVPQSVYDNYKKFAQKGAAAAAGWNKLFAAYSIKYPQAKEFYAVVDEQALLNDKEFWDYEDKPQANLNLLYLNLLYKEKK